MKKTTTILLLGAAGLALLGKKSRVNGTKDATPIEAEAEEQEQLTVVPVDAKVNSGYGWRMHPIDKVRKFHKGLDMKAPTGTPVYAAGDGVVEFAGKSGGYGNLIRLDHGDGLTTRYAHLHKILVKKDAVVTAGQQIGEVGTTGKSTGPHLHFEVRLEGLPMDPRIALPEIQG